MLRTCSDLSRQPPPSPLVASPLRERLLLRFHAPYWFLIVAAGILELWPAPNWPISKSLRKSMLWSIGSTAGAMMRRRGSRPKNAGRWCVGLPSGQTRCECGSKRRWSSPRSAAPARARAHLVNALLGAEVVQTGRSRPTTTRPTLICRPGLTPEMLGIERASVEWIERDLPALRDLVLVDCPDPDTTEEREGEGERGRLGDKEIGELQSPHLPVSPLRLSLLLPATTSLVCGRSCPSATCCW